MPRWRFVEFKTSIVYFYKPTIVEIGGLILNPTSIVLGVVGLLESYKQLSSLPIELYQEQQRITHKDFVILCILSSLLNYKSRLLEWCSESRQNWPNSVINFSGAFFPYLFYLFRIYLLVSFLLQYSIQYICLYLSGLFVVFYTVHLGVFFLFVCTYYLCIHGYSCDNTPCT